MFYKKKYLPRLWEVEIYESNPDGESEIPTRKETLVAWNAVDAIRRAGNRVAKQPKALHFITHPEYEGGPIYRINSPQDGPIGDPIVPSIAVVEPDDW